jgi:purine-nucleoside/S-methyl-5'-thioadenosine phosphorylase / adenosine deaminase
VVFHQKNGLRYLKFPPFEEFPGIWHGIFTRHTGHSSGPYQSLNVSFGVGDKPDNVIRNRSLISGCADTDDLVFCRQVHGTQTIEIRQRNPQNSGRHPDNPPVGDAMVSNVPNKFLVVQVADCQPVLIVDPIRQVVANVHAGWRGSVQNILGSTIHVMEMRFGCRPNDMVAAIGPSLGPCCAEFVNYKKEIPPGYWKYKNDVDFFDFWAISRDQLQQAGVLPGSIYSSGMCTRCQTDLFFSYRGEGITGRFAAVIGLRTNPSG